VTDCESNIEDLINHIDTITPDDDDKKDIQINVRMMIL
jgi:hypothetical protein